MPSDTAHWMLQRVDLRVLHLLLVFLATSAQVVVASAACSPAAPLAGIELSSTQVAARTLRDFRKWEYSYEHDDSPWPRDPSSNSVCWSGGREGSAPRVRQGSAEPFARQLGVLEGRRDGGNEHSSAVPQCQDDMVTLRAEGPTRLGQTRHEVVWGECLSERVSRRGVSERGAAGPRAAASEAGRGSPGVVRGRPVSAGGLALRGGGPEQGGADEDGDSDLSTDDLANVYDEARRRPPRRRQPARLLPARGGGGEEEAHGVGWCGRFCLGR